MAKILVVDDEASIRNLILLTLSTESYETMEAKDGEEAYRIVQENTFDLVLLDIMLPKMDGYELLQRLKTKHIPVIFLSAKISLQDKVLGLKLGADDYITKPFEPMELLARVEVALRKTKDTGANKNKGYKYNEIVLYPDERLVKYNGDEIILTMKEFDLLKIFLENANIVLSRETLLDKVWGYDYYGGTRTVDMHIKQLRSKLHLKTELQTIYKIGYKLRGNVYEIEE